MLTKIFTIYTIFCGICFLYFFATIITIAWDIHHDNPNFKSQTNKVVVIASFFKMVILSVLPIVNMSILFMCMFHYKEMKERFEQALL